MVQEEFAETIHLNESLGAPSSRAMQRLFAGIDAEPARKPSVSCDLQRPRRRILCKPVAAHAGLCRRPRPRVALLLQAGVIGAVLVKQSQGNFQSAAYQAQTDSGVRALVRFAPEARVADITQFLDTYNASILAGLKAGMFRVQFEKRMTKDEIDEPDEEGRAGKDRQLRRARAIAGCKFLRKLAEVSHGRRLRS